jgi:RimJ/RimL family protein N-acetyltransferase
MYAAPWTMSVNLAGCGSVRERGRPPRIRLQQHQPAAVEDAAMQNAFLIGPTVYLRPLEPDDARTIVPWFNDPDVLRFLQRYRPMTHNEEIEFLHRLSESQTDLALGIVPRAEERLVGVTGLHLVDLRNRHAAFGICIGDKAAWSKGYGSEATRLVVRHAFDTMNLNRVWLHVYEYNPRAARVYQKVGFRQEGRLRQDTFRDGRYWDTVVMGVLREEWETVDYTPEERP